MRLDATGVVRPCISRGQGLVMVRIKPYNLLKGVICMYTVKLRELPPIRYETVEGAWDCKYIGPRRACLCEPGCRCRQFEKFKMQLETVGIVKLHATIVTRDDVQIKPS